MIWIPESYESVQQFNNPEVLLLASGSGRQIVMTLTSKIQICFLLDVLDHLPTMTST
jgi:hypothetical protein